MTMLGVPDLPNERVFGLSAPPQCLDDMPLDRELANIDVRIDRANRGAYGGMSQPKTDPLTTTMEVVRSKSHVFEIVLPQSNKEFHDTVRSKPLQDG